MFAAPILAEGLDGPPTSVALSVVLGGFFALLSLRNCLRLLRPRPVATTAMVVSLAACAILTALLVSGPILESAAPLRGVLVLPALAVLLVALAGESVRRVNLKQA
jgi:heme A synthase